MSEIPIFDLPNGLRLAVEPVPGAASVAASLLLPAGSATDAPDEDGLAAMLAELIFRGAGGRSSRDHSDALDRLGVQRASSVAGHHLQVGATFLGLAAPEVLPLLLAMVTSPALADEHVEPVSSLCLQAIESLEDDPQHQVMLALRERHRPAPYNRHGYGRAEVIEAATGPALRDAWRERAVPGGSILALAGAVDPGAIRDQVAELVGDWRGAVRPEPVAGVAERGVAFIEQETAQVHLAFAWDAASERDEDAILERLATAVLGGSTSGRLFTEVRQKRSLCYGVWATYRAGRDDGAVSVYAGTTPERAQETLDVCLAEVARMREGVDREEFERATIGLKSRLVMSGESTSARAARLASDLFRLGRPRGLDELLARVDAVSLEELNAWLARRETGPFTFATIGPRPLEVPVAAASAG